MEKTKMGEWIKIDSVTEFTDEVKVYTIKGHQVVVFKLEDGFYGIENICSHEEAFLSEGEVEEGEVECPMHGARFDIRTGKNLSFPAVIPVKSYPVKIEAGEIFLHTED
jgi:3-phenylpropionate/trans-cinnamate dioxygenase ferredoxin subunit